MDRRGPQLRRPAPGPFHCIACKSYVTGTPSGHCPRCGFVPPVALETEAGPASSGPRMHWVLALVVASAVLLLLLR